ncbi:hypothetical protein J5N97_016791 [Dioscorea zingiberensis]|uniref:Uncharacterized protein n=1 Tax=Dioscorea zingiberensis TaxID=325984 RepID=A0A9D5CJZ4_9LILI|nr:hypothetical protein J5N97_016791 [Dioscorea zingiberensis]
MESKEEGNCPSVASKDYMVMISVAFLVILFSVQRFGTSKVVTLHRRFIEMKYLTEVSMHSLSVSFYMRLIGECWDPEPLDIVMLEMFIIMLLKLFFKRSSSLGPVEGCKLIRKEKHLHQIKSSSFKNLITKKSRGCQLAIKQCGTSGTRACISAYRACNEIFNSILEIVGNINIWSKDLFVNLFGVGENAFDCWIRLAQMDVNS